MTASLADFLATVRLFQELSAAQRDALAQRTSQRTLEAGETVFFQRDPADRVKSSDHQALTSNQPTERKANRLYE